MSVNKNDNDTLNKIYLFFLLLKAIDRTEGDDE